MPNPGNDGESLPTDGTTQRVLPAIVTFDAPGGDDLDDLIENLMGRFNGQPEAFSSFARELLDRQISKASGLLSANALLLAALAVAADSGTGVVSAHPGLTMWSCILLLCSAALCFRALFTHWDLRALGAPLDDGKKVVEVSAARSWHLNVACSIGAAVMIMWVVAFVFRVLPVEDRPTWRGWFAGNVAPWCFVVACLLVGVSRVYQAGWLGRRKPVGGAQEHTQPTGTDLG